jgi:hypothetical protein
MNKLTNIQSARRDRLAAVKIKAPLGAINVCFARRRELVCAWTIDPVSGRLVCSWSRHSLDEGRPTSDSDAIAAEIPICLALAC